MGDYDNAKNENAIRKVDVFFYRGETQVWYAEQVMYDASSKKAIIAVPSSKETLFDGTQSYDVYIVVNGPTRAEMEGKSLADLKNVVLTHSNTGFDFSLTNRNPSDSVCNGWNAGRKNRIIGIADRNRNVARAAPDQGKDIEGEISNIYRRRTSGATPLISVKNYKHIRSVMQGRTKCLKVSFPTPIIR